MYLTVVRSPYYADHGRAPLDRCRFTDQGAHKFSYTFGAYAKDSRSSLIKDARMLNTDAVVIIENNHNGTLNTEFSGISSSAENVQISAIKRSEDGCGTVVRVYETDGKSTEFKISGSILPKELCASITPCSINTYYLKDGTEEWREVLLTEFDL
jgi:alpha-mannosidase